MIHGRIGCRYLDGTADASTAVGAITAVLVGAGATGDEAGEDGVDDACAVGVGTRLKACVADVGDAVEAELLGEVEAFFARGVGDRDGECDILQAC